MNNKYRILHLEDNRLDAELVRQRLKSNEYLSDYLLVEEKENFISAINSFRPDIILSDLNLPEFSGFDALNWLTQKASHIPVIIITGTMDEETADQMIRLGAWDFVVKDRLHRLLPAIDSVMRLKKEKDKARSASQLAQNILETTPSAVFTVDPEGVITSWNKMAETITGFKEEEVMGKNCAIMNSSTCGNCSLFGTHESPGPWLNKECDLTDKDGNVHYILKNTDLLKNEHGEVIGGIESFVDQSDKVKMNIELKREKERAEESDRLKSAFLANISHEIRTPLNAIIGFSDLVIDEDIDPEDKLAYTQIIKTGSDQLLAILNNILQISLIETGQIELNIKSFSLEKMNSSLEVMWQDQFKEKQIHFQYKAGNEATIQTDKNRLLSILNSLLENALKFTDHGRVEFGHYILENKVTFYVADSGAGIEESVGNLVFDRFYRIKDEAHVNRGSGLGLAISKAVAEALGGKIWYESIAEKGSTFYLEIPIALSQ